VGVLVPNDRMPIMAGPALSTGRAMRRLAAALALGCCAALGRIDARAQDAAPAESLESPRMPGVGFEELSRRAQEEWDAGPSHARTALRFYRAGVELNPRWADGWWHIGLVYFNTGRFEDARTALQRLLALVPDSGPGWSLLGTCDYRLSNYDLALSELVQGRRLGVSYDDSLGQEAARSLALLFVRSGRSRAAEKELARLLSNNRDDPELLLACGLLGLQMKLFPDEIPDTDRDLVQRVGRATAAALAWRSDEAKALFDDVLARYPRARGVHFIYGRFLMLDATPEAGASFRSEVALFPDHVDALVEVALDALGHDRAADAVAPAKTAVRLAPETVWSHYALGRALVATGATSDGVSELERAHAIKPAEPDVLLALAQAYARAGRTQEVERVRAELQAVSAYREAHLLR
jgi:tetratricopeptide (TPR) repeat protein